MKTVAAKTKAAILILSFILQSMNTVALVISGVAKAHPEASVTSVQLVYTLITLIGVPAMLTAGKLVNLFTKKVLSVASCALLLAGGLIGYFCSDSLMMLYAASVLIGTGNSMLTPLSSGLIAEHFVGDERASLTGVQSLFINGGAIALNMLAGFLGSTHWQGSYLLFLITVPVMLVLLVMLPAGSVEKAASGEKVKLLSPYLLSIMLQAFLFGLGYMTFMTNIALYVEDMGVGSASVLTSVQSFGGIAIGLILSRVMKITGKYCFSLASVFGAVSMILLCFANNLTVLLAASLTLGLGFGLFMPAGCVLIPNAVPPSAVTMGISLMMVAFSMSGFANPYIVTMGAGLINASISTRFAVAAVILVLNVIFGIIAANKTEQK